MGMGLVIKLREPPEDWGLEPRKAIRDAQTTFYTRLTGL
jgi:hypothetical protein